MALFSQSSLFSSFITFLPLHAENYCKASEGRRKGRIGKEERKFREECNTVQMQWIDGCMYE